MNIFLWILQVLLALVVLAAGAPKLIQPREQVTEKIPAIKGFTSGQIKGLGALEVLAAIGLIAPAATGIATFLTPSAAVGVALLMVGATIAHLRIREYPNAVVTVVILALAVVVAWGRFGPHSL